MIRLSLRQPDMLYQNTYLCLVIVSALDAIMTHVILWQGGVEVNWLADAVLYRYGFPGMVAFKFALVTLVICICEVVGRKRPGTVSCWREWRSG